MSNFIRGFRDCVIAVLITVAMLLMIAFVPAFAIAGMAVCGVPVAFLAAKHKLKFTIPALIVLFGLLYGMSANILNAAELMLMMIIPGAVAGYMIGEKNPFYSTLLAVCVTVSVGWLMALYEINTTIEGGIAGMFDAMKPEIEASVVQVVEQMKQMGIDKEMQSMMSAVPEMVNMAIGTFRFFMPAIVVIIAAVLGYAILRICGFFVRVTKASNVEIVPFYMMKATRSMSIIAVLCSLVSFFISAESTFGAVVSNASMVLEFLLALCGISFIDYMFRKAVRITVLRWLIYSGVFMFLFATMMYPFVSYGLVILGILDAGRDFRKIDSWYSTEL